MLVARCRAPAAALALAALTLLAARSARAQPADEDPAAFDARIAAELREKDAAAADVFAQANAARDAGDLARAATLYGDVHTRAPWFFHATRRLCGVEAELGHRARAITLCEEARSRADTPENDAALAEALLVHDGDEQPSRVQALRALDLARAATKRVPNEAFAWQAMCAAAIETDHVADLDACSAALLRIAPTNPGAHVMAAIDATAHDRFDEARAEADRARALGMTEPDHAKLLAMIDEAASPLPRWARVALGALAAWVATFIALLGAGYALSRATLARASSAPAERDGHARGGDALLRRVYAVVLGATCAFYYASLPLVAAGVLVLGAAVLYATFAVGRVPIRLLLIVLAVVLYTLVAIARSLFVRGRDEAPGERLEMRAHPRFDAALAEVAARIGTRRVDAVYLTPGTEVAVTERGGMLRRLRGTSERALVLGAGVLEGMRVRELKAILAHEYGHFVNRDTAGGGFALAVRRSLLTMAIGLARSGVATFYNPAWWFVRGFHAVFLRVSQGASRLQEILADRWAAYAYGAAAFERGLVHVVARDVRFDAHADATLKEAIERRAPLANLYAFTPSAAPDADKLDLAVQAAIAREPSATDSHPSPAQRIAWVTALGTPGTAPASSDDDGPAWSLFEGRAELERWMTDVVRRRLFARGVEIKSE